MSINIQDFIDLLKSKARTWSEVADGELGLRVIKFSGDIVRSAIEGDLTKDWLDRLFALLPKDACLMDAGHAIVWMEYEVGAYYDRYCLIVGSKEWPALKEGEPIPELQPLFYKDEPHRDTLQPTIQLPPMVEDQTHWLIGNEKQMYYSVDKWGVLQPLLLNPPPTNIAEMAQGKPSFIPMAHENNSTATGIEAIREQRRERARELGYPVDEKTGHVTSGMGADCHIVAEELKQEATWICTAHAPGSEVEVKKGEACYCGRVEP